MSQPRYWIGVVSRAHVERGVAGGFAQLCHGKAAPLQRMQPGDWLVYYSPRTELHGSVSCQAFTAIGRIADDDIQQVDLGDFCPFRRRVTYLECQAAPIGPLLRRLSFTAGVTHWGYRFRTGHFAITKEDFTTIATAMDATPVDDEVGNG